MITGFNINVLPFSNLGFVGALLFKEYPSTMVYADQSNIPYIVEWVDVDDETGLDRFFIFKTSTGDLKRYIDGQISHYELIIQADSGVVAFYDGSIGQPENIRLSSVDNISPDYLPSPSSYFNFQDSEDIDIIIEFFSLLNYQVPVKQQAELSLVKKIEYYSERSKTDLFCLHLNNGKYVGHGKIQTEVLANTLSSFEGLYHEIVNDRMKGKERTKQIRKKQDKINYENIAYTEVIIQEAASFAVYIRPKTTIVNLNFNPTEEDGLATTQGEQVFHDVLEVITNSKSPDLINSVREKYSSVVFGKVKELATQVKKYDLVIDLNFYSPYSKNKFDQQIDLSSANHILQTLTNTLMRESDKLELIGRFTALNCNTGYFAFVTNQDEEFSGKFHEIVRESMPTLNFIDLFDIVIERDLTKNIADAEYKTTDILVSVVKRP